MSNNFDEQLSITEVKGKPNVVTLKKHVDKILNDCYEESCFEEDKEFKKLIQQAGSVIKEEIQKLDNAQTSYPVPEDINLESLASEIPESLKVLMSEVMPRSRSESAKLKKKLLQIGVSHVFLQSASRLSYISLFYCQLAFLYIRS